MIERVVSFLNQPYPFYYRGKNLVTFILAVFLISLAFNYLIEPFNVYLPEHKMDYFWISFIHSCTPIIITILMLPFLKNPKNDEKWTVGKEIVLLAIFLFLIGLVQFLIRDIIYDNPENWSWKYFFEEIKNTFLVGTFMLFILIPLNHNRLNYKNTQKAKELTSYKSSNKLHPENTSVFIRTQVKGDDFSLNVVEFVYAKSEGNYVEMYIEKENSIDILLKRISIKELENQLISYPFVQRTHRSYIVNLNHIEKVSGNAQGYRLSLKNHNSFVPVSRNMIPVFEKSLNQV